MFYTFAKNNYNYQKTCLYLLKRKKKKILIFQRKYAIFQISQVQILLHLHIYTSYKAAEFVWLHTLTSATI